MSTERTHDLSTFFPSPTDQAISYNRLDEMMFSRVADSAPILPESVRFVQGQLGTGKSEARSIAFDAFGAVYRFDPKESGMGSPLNRDVLSRVMKDARYNELHQMTVGDEVASALASVALTKTVAENIPDEVKKKAREEQEARDEANDAKVYADELAEDNDATAEQIFEARRAAEKKRAVADQAAKNLSVAIRDGGEKMTRAVGIATAQACEEAETSKQVAEAFGTGSFDPSGGMDAAARFALAKTVQKSGPAFKAMLKIIGKLVQERAEKQSRKFSSDHGDIAEVGQGSDVDRLLDEELAALSDRADTLALARFADGDMMQVEVDSRETAVKGDVIILLDESGSMAAAVGKGPTTREAEAKGITIAIAHAMLKERRSVKVLFFQSEVTHTIDITPSDVSRKENGMSVASRKLSEIATRALGGGTMFDAPLTKAMDVLASGSMKGADVMMITDGVSTVSDKVVERITGIRKTHGVTFYGMGIGPESRVCAPVFARFADKVFCGDSLLAGASELVEIL